MNSNVSRSWEQYKQTCRYLGQGSSTLSKQPVFTDSEPALIVRGCGCRVWDADGNEYIDFRNGMGPVSLGYAVAEIDNAVTEQLKCGIVFGHPHPLEGQVAKLLVDLIPCAQRVRFLKTGGEAAAACIRIARHATKRNKILQCGYNGWLNSLSSGSVKPSGAAAGQPTRGVPHAVSALYQSLRWADLDQWKQAFVQDGHDIAAVVIACDYKDMEKGREFLPAIRKLTRQYGALMIMDEIVTGFRLAAGGAHEYFGLEPDMAVFGKALANGMPLSAYVGRGELIDLTKELGISSTFGGEALSLAAAKATIGFYREHRVIDHLWQIGKMIWPRVNLLLDKHGIPIRLNGPEVCPLIESEDQALVPAFFKACYKHGVSLYHVPYVNYAHKHHDIEQALERIEQAIIEMKRE